VGVDGDVGRREGGSNGVVAPALVDFVLVVEVQGIAAAGGDELEQGGGGIGEAGEVQNLERDVQVGQGR